MYKEETKIKEGDYIVSLKSNHYRNEGDIFKAGKVVSGIDNVYFGPIHGSIFTFRLATQQEIAKHLGKEMSYEIY